MEGNMLKKTLEVNPEPAKPGQILKEFPSSKASKNKPKIPMFVIVIFVVLAGVATGWLLSGTSMKKGSGSVTPTVVQTKNDKGEVEAGVLETGVEYDEVEGKLVEGGIKGEGTHHLERAGGESQNVYLTSSTLDLQSYVGKKVKVWGITVSGQFAGWLMDVGKISELD